MENTNTIINIALIGNANVGKSVIFNQLTGLSQSIGNWPGKTVEKKEGHLNFLGYSFNIVDLPGIYSLSTYSLEEIVSREYIVSDEVDIVINVIDATNFERNLFFTFQLLELKVPLIIAINQMDILRKRGRDINFILLQEIFKLPVVPVVAIHGIGVDQLIKEAIKLVEKPFQYPDLLSILFYGKEVEIKVRDLIKEIEANWEINYRYTYPSRFLAIKILENDEEIKKVFELNQNSSVIFKLANEYRKELEEYHGEDIDTIISSEIYNNIHKIIERVLIVKSQETRKRALADKLDHLTTHSFWGYIFLVLVLLGTYYYIFLIGDLLGGIIETIFSIWSKHVYEIYGDQNVFVLILWDGGMGGFLGAIGGVLVYVIPFFLIIEILQDSGYLPRAAFLMDRFMHFLGVHGKTIIPMILGFGCNVPACAACRIMETPREKKISVALTSLIPCAAVMVVVLGLVGRYLGLGWVLFLFGINLSVIILIGRILNKVMPGKCTELIMEMHEYRIPNYGVIMKQTWIRTKEFIYKSLPIIISIGILLEVLFIFKLLDPINIILSPITVFWLGLPLITGIFLIYGILRKELTLILLTILASSKDLTLLELLTPIQMIIFCIVTMLYIPCFATIVLIAKETNWKYTFQIAGLEIGIALLVGGVINWGYFLFTSL
ncbi:MAG: ferrous iron transport protein B [Candidatus Hodarchaeota archaeon]